MSKIGIAISTYTRENTDQARYDIIDKSLSSLVQYLGTTKLNIFTVIVVDGLIPAKHHDIINRHTQNGEYSINVYHREENGGVARTKNTSIRILMEQNIDYGFLMDDDVIYKRDCLETYVNAMQKTNVSHMGFCQMSKIVHPEKEWSKMGYYQTCINDYPVMRHGGGGVGCLLSFTPSLVKAIGYFKVMPGKYGYEHINFTRRAIHQGLIPFACDVVDSEKYIEHIGFEPVGYNKFNKIHSIDEEFRKKENTKNKDLWKQGLNNKEPCIE